MNYVPAFAKAPADSGGEYPAPSLRRVRAGGVKKNFTFPLFNFFFYELFVGFESFSLPGGRPPYSNSNPNPNFLPWRISESNR